MNFLTTTDGIRGLLPYRSTFNARIRGDKGAALASQRVYRFKSGGESAEVWRRLIEQARVELGCVSVWVVPGHEVGTESHLQRLLGASIRRLRSVPPRKYGHKEPFDCSALVFPESPGGKVLLVDDVATSGGTLRAIRDHLAGKGAEAVPLTLGLNWKLILAGTDTEALSRQWEAAAAEVHEPKGTPQERRAARRHAVNLLGRRPCADKARRARLEGNPAAWLRFYLASAYPLPWGQVHKDMIEAAVRSIRTGAGMVCAAPRSTGKSAVLFGVALWALLSGACRFPVVAGWAHGAARRMLRKWLSTLADNPRIQADYPEATQPFEESTHANRLKGIGWQDTGELCGADVRIMDGVLAMPDSKGALGAVSINGSARGLYAGLPDGSTIRPDVLLLDDPQDKDTAKSPAQVWAVVERIESTAIP